MKYQGDVYTFTLFLTHSDGTTPTITANPVIQIVRLSDGTAVLTIAQNMVTLDSSNQTWYFNWAIPTNAATGEYIAITSYAADGNVFTDFPIEKITVGDTRITNIVAIEDTTAKDATVAKDSTVAHVTDVANINPNTSSVILGIKAKTDALPADPTSMAGLSALVSNILDIHDALLENQVVDKTVNPAVYTLKRSDNSVLVQFQLIESDASTSRVKI